jgi:hypothetical protein
MNSEGRFPNPAAAYKAGWALWDPAEGEFRHVTEQGVGIAYAVPEGAVALEHNVVFSHAHGLIAGAPLAVVEAAAIDRSQIE